MSSGLDNRDAIPAECGGLYGAAIKVRVRGIPVGSRASFEAMNRAIEINDLKPVIDRVFPWTEAADALRHLERGGHFGKVVLQH